MTDTPILHVDMDAFFASVALRSRPELHELPVVVGGGYRGVVLAANYHARRFGVRSGMPSARARRLCPSLVAVPVDHDEVARVSTAIMEIFRRATPVVEVASPDEAFLDVRGAVRLLGSPVQIAERLRSAVHDEQAITCSVGVAATVPVAKVASRRAKPDGVLVVPPDEVAAFLGPLDVGELYGVGQSTRSALHRLGLRTVEQLVRVPLSELARHVGEGQARRLHDLARGEGRRELETRTMREGVERSMGAQHTVGRDLSARAEVCREVLRLADRVARRVRAAGLAGHTVTLTVRFSDFETITRSRTLPEPSDVTQEIYRVACDLYDALGPHGRSLRLVGVRVERLVPRGGVHHQLVLGEREHGWAEADRAVDLASARFGGRVVGPASLVRAAGRPHRGVVERTGEVQIP